MRILNFSILFFLCLNVKAAIVEVPTPSGNLVVKTEDYMQFLYIDGKKTDVTDKYINITRILPTPSGVLDLYLVELNSGGSGTLPYYHFLTHTFDKFELSKSFEGTIKSLSNDGETVKLELNAIYNKFDNTLISPPITVSYKNSKLYISNEVPEKNNTHISTRNNYRPPTQNSLVFTKKDFYVKRMKKFKFMWKLYVKGTLQNIGDKGIKNIIIDDVCHGCATKEERKKNIEGKWTPLLETAPSSRDNILYLSPNGKEDFEFEIGITVSTIEPSIAPEVELKIISFEFVD